MPDAAVRLRIEDEVLDVQAFQPVPGGGRQGVEMVVVDMISLQVVQLLVQQLIQVVPLQDQGERHLGRDLHLLPIAVGERSSDEGLVPIHPRRIQVVHSVVDGVAELPRRPLLVNGPTFLRQPHASKSQCRQAVVRLFHCPVLHIVNPRISLKATFTTLSIKFRQYFLVNRDSQVIKK